MKTLAVNKIGVDVSDGNPFGDVLSIAPESRFLIRLKHPDYYNIEYSLNYRKTDDGFIQLIMVLNGKPQGILAQLRIQGETLPEQMGFALIGYMVGTSFWWGFPKYVNSPVLKASDLEKLVSHLRSIRDANYAAAMARKPRLIRLLRKAGYRSVPDYWTTGRWFANCPGSGEPHTIHISTVTNEWECTHCNRKGDGRAFTRWLKELKKLKPGAISGRTDRLNGTNIVFKD